MRIYVTFLAALAMLTCAASCSHQESHNVSLDLSVSNAMTSAYWVWSDTSVCSAGILSPGVSSTDLDIPPPNIDTVILDLVADTNRQHHATIKVDVSPLRRLSSGRHEAVISLVSESQAKLYIDGHEQ